MQAQMQKKDKSPVVFCPRCHAQNMASQSRCGKCGYVFPTKGSYKGEKKGKMPGAPDAGAPPMVPAANPAPAGGPMGMGGGPAGGMGGEGGEGQPSGGSDEPPKLTRPKAIPEKGVSEGPMASHGNWVTCPRCGADLKADAKRCSRCGYKPGLG